MIKKIKNDTSKNSNGDANNNSKCGAADNDRVR